MIYGHALGTNGTVHIAAAGHDYRGRRGLKASYGAKLHSDYHPRILSLLLVDRATYNEAREFLYKKQHFVFAAMADFNQFMRMIGDAKQFLTRITVDRSGTSILSKCYELLTEATRLQSFSICLPQNFKGTLAEHIDKHWESLAEFLMANCADAAESLRRLAKIAFTVGPAQSGVTDALGEPIRYITPRMNERCRERVKRLLRAEFTKKAQGTK